MSVIKKKTTAPFVINLEAGLTSLYVYSDVIEAQIIGDSMVPLLRIISVEGKDGDIISKAFQKKEKKGVRRMHKCIIFQAKHESEAKTQ